jgi:hypothetical protein
MIRVRSRSGDRKIEKMHIASWIQGLAIVEGFLFGEPVLPKLGRRSYSIVDLGLRERDDSSKDSPPLRVKLKDKLRYGAKVAPSATKCPE